jgi:hypothetical protein
MPYEDFSCTVTMMSGLPGSGKDTWLAEHHRDLPVSFPQACKIFAAFRLF